MQATQPLTKLANPTCIKSVMDSRNTIHIPTIEYMADRKKCFKDITCIKNRIEAGTESYNEGMEYTSLRKFLAETKTQKNKYKWKGFTQLEFNLNKEKNLFIREKITKFENSLDASMGNGLSKLIQTFNPSLITLKITIRANFYLVFKDGDMEHLSLQIAHHLPQLKEFYIMIVDCDTFTDKGVKTLIKKLAQNCFDLETIELSFPACSFVTDESLKCLLYDFSRSLKKLKNLDISVSECRKITKKSLEYLRKDLRSCKFQSLESLSLNFDLCFNMCSENCFVELEDDVSQYLPNLQRFYLK